MCTDMHTLYNLIFSVVNHGFSTNDILKLLKPFFHFTFVFIKSCCLFERQYGTCVSYILPHFRLFLRVFR